LLYNLKEDMEEKKNLAQDAPVLVSELDALIETFLQKTAAKLPVPNPAFEPSKYDPSREGKPGPKNRKKQ
jgi:hypothetical protein